MFCFLFLKKLAQNFYIIIRNIVEHRLNFILPNWLKLSSDINREKVNFFTKTGII